MRKMKNMPRRQQKAAGANMRRGGGSMGRRRRPPPRLAFKVPEETYRTNYLGSKQKFVGKIVDNAPEDVETVLDGFAGSNVVGYAFKRDGRQVISNDTLRYSHHIAKAIIENSHTRLSDDHIAMLMREDSQHPHTTLNKYRGVYFTPAILNEIDSIRYNIDKMGGYKRDIALAALGRTLITSQSFQNFSITNKTKVAIDNRNKQLQGISAPGVWDVHKFRDIYINNCKYLNSLVFDNKKANKAFRKDIRKLAKTQRTDVAYFDPPYVTQFSNPDYDGRYHFVEGVMADWKGGTFEQRRDYSKFIEGNRERLTKTNIGDFFNNFMGDKPKYIMLSYRDKSHPTEREIKDMLKSKGYKVVKDVEVNHKYQTSHTDASEAVEHIYIAEKR